MRIAFVLDESVQVGGGFQQSLSTISSLRALQGHDLIVFTTRTENLAILRTLGIRCELHRFNRYRRLLARTLLAPHFMKRLFRHLPRALQHILEPLGALLDRHHVDVVICFFLSWVPHHLYRHPFIATVYDLCHRDHPEFPEVSERYEFESREHSLRQSLPRALAVLVSSTSLARKIAQYYGVDETRAVVLPFVPALHSRLPADEAEKQRVQQRYALPLDYVFYPAQFWPHKNHIYLLEGLRLLKDRTAFNLHAVFCGSDFGNETHVRRAAESLQLQDSVHFLGFVESADMRGLYSCARALVMPTYFGPTNIPPLEAMATGCPIIYSDIPEFREDLADAALYCDLSNPASLATHLNTLMTRPEVVEALKLAADARMQRGEISYAHSFQRLFDDLAYISRRWA